MGFSKISTIGLAKECESPENPGSLEKRAALIPENVRELVNHGYKVYFETGAGEGIEFTDEEYTDAGAISQDHQQIYKNKDMVIKFKGPSLESIPLMKHGTILFCMAHFRSFPDRAKLLEENKINVMAMEEILENPKIISDEIILSKRFVQEALLSQSSFLSELNLCFLGYDPLMIGGIRRAGNRNTNTLFIYQSDVIKEELAFFGEKSLYFYDSRIFNNPSLISYLKEKSCQLFDLVNFNEKKGKIAIKQYRASHPAFKFGGRRIQCLHETGMAGARYGFNLLKNVSLKNKIPQKANVAVLGYGNVGMGAINECYDQGARIIQVLGRVNTTPEKIVAFIENSDLIVNGAEQPPELRGKNFLITSNHTQTVLEKGTVVIDLVGGSPSNRSPVEDITECTFLTNPYFEKNGILFSSLWGWPMMGMMRETAIKYSGQIVDVLINQENLLKGLEELSPGLEAALVCGPFKILR